ncbi:outer membrane protein assembly factor [Vulgatibacter sp.]|uniref:BamA/OMP85 family outer membrane protein n=1 Tax=Vulgatibacter sp. TaxID=1971226 RepID=UPI003566ACBC
MWFRLAPFLPLLLAACASTPAVPELVQTGPVVKELRVLGNEEVSDSLIRSRIATRETNRFLFFGGVHRLDPGAVAQDLRRIRDIYQEQGFYAAQVDSEVRSLGDDEVEIDFLVNEGPPTEIRTFLVEGLDDLEPEVLAKVLEDPPLERGDRFVEADWLAWKESVVARLRNRGYADASVEARVEVGPAEGTADLILVAEPGRIYEFGEIAVEGNLLVDETRIRNAALPLLERGDRYSPTAMEEAQAEVFGLGVFSVATVTDRERAERRAAARRAEAEAAALRAAEGEPVEPAAAEPPAPIDQGPAVAPVVIAVNEADFLRIRVGAGVGLDQSYYQARALAEFTHLNVFGGLQQLHWSNQLAYRFLNPGAELVGESGPAGSSVLSLTQPDLITTRVDLSTSVAYERELTPSYTAQSVTGRIGTPIRFRHWLYLTPSYNVTHFFDVSVFNEDEVVGATPGVRPSLVGDCPAGCTLSWVEQLLVADRRDNLLEPRRGWYASFGVQEGGLGGDFAWLRFTPEARGYIPLGEEWVLAGRLAFGYLHPLSTCDPEQALDPYLDDVGCSPIVVRYFGGGADGFRGFGADRLSPLQAVEVDGETRYIPLGGNSSVLGTTEFRWYFAESWSSAFFLDAGNVAAEPAAAFRIADLQLAAGAGLRYRTPVGPARLDVGYRVLRDPSIPVNGGDPVEQNTLDYFAIFLSIGEAF